MKKLIELLLQQTGTAVTLYYPGQTFTGVLEQRSDGELLALSSGEKTIWLDAEPLLGVIVPEREAEKRVSAEKSQKTVGKETSNQKDKLRELVKRIDRAEVPQADIVSRIRTDVMERVRSYPDLEECVSGIFSQLDRGATSGADRRLLEQAQMLKEQKPGCATALQVLEAGIHYVGDNKEKALELLWNSDRFESALAVLREMTADELFYMDCQGYAVSEAEYRHGHPELYYDYVRRCAEYRDVSGVLDFLREDISESGETEEARAVLLYLLWKKDAAALEEQLDKTMRALLLAVMRAYPGGAFGERQERLEGKLQEWFKAAPVRYLQEEESGQEGQSVGTSSEERPPVLPAVERCAMHRWDYYTGVIWKRFDIADGKWKNFNVELSAGRNDELYMNPLNISDPLLMHKLLSPKGMFGEQYKGTKVWFRFGRNARGLCAADVVMAPEERQKYRETLRGSEEIQYSMPSGFVYLSETTDAAEAERFGAAALEQSASRLREQDADTVELMTFFYAFLTGRADWKKIGYPRVILDATEVTEYLEGLSGEAEDWIDALTQFLKTGGHRDWAELIVEMRGSMSCDEPLYMKLKAAPEDMSPEELEGEYIFPECSAGGYAGAQEYIDIAIQKRREQLTKKRKPLAGKPWERLQLLKQICQAAQNGDDEGFVRGVRELEKILTDNQCEKLKGLLEAAERKEENG